MSMFIRMVWGLLAAVVTASLVVAVPVEPAAAAVCYVGSEGGTEEVWYSDGADLTAQRIEDDTGLVLGTPDVGYEWRVPVCVAIVSGDSRIIGSVSQVVSSEARADEQLALQVVLAGLKAASQRPVPRIAPAVDQLQVVGLETWLAVDPSTYGDVLVRSERAGDVVVSATATPVGLIWMFDDGSTVRELECDGPGVLYSEAALASLGGPPCGWDWEHTTRVAPAEMSVVIAYDVEWTSSLGSSGTFVDRRGFPLTTISLDVDEAQSVGVWGERNRPERTGLPEVDVEIGDCSLLAFSDGECSNFVDPTEDWGLPPECSQVASAASGFWDSLVGGGKALLNLGGSFIDVVFRGEDLDAVRDAGRGFVESAEGVAIGVVEFGGELWSCGSWAVGELYELLPPELRFLTDLTLGCSRIGLEALQGVWQGVQMAAQASSDPAGFIAEQVDMAMAVKAQVEADPEGFAREMLGGVFDEDLYNENRNQWIGKMVCEVIIIVLSAVFTGGAGIAARFGPKVAKVFAKLDDLIPDLPGRNKRKGCNSFPAGTLVLMADGSHTPIELVAPGDRVLTYNTDSGVWSGNVVLDQWSGVHAREMVTVTLADGSEVSSTDDHLFWVSSDGEWVEADQLRPGDLLLTPDGVTPIAGVSVQDPEPLLVWELDTAVDDTFTVAADSHNVVVHNCGDGTKGSQTADLSPSKFSKGKLKEHFDKHGKEFGEITQNEYLKFAKEFATEVGDGIIEQKVGNFLVKFDPATNRMLIVHAGKKEIRTFYKPDARDADPFAAAVKLAEELGASGGG